MFKSFLILTLVITFFLTTPFVVFAQQVEQGENVIVSEDQSLIEDFFATGETVAILGSIQGDAYVAGGTVSVDGEINGDLLVAGGTVTMRGKVTGNIRAIAGTVTISGEVGGNVTSLAGTTLITENATINGSIVAGTGTLEVLAPIGRGMTFAAGNATLASTVKGNILAGVGQLTLANNSLVDGNLIYYSEINSPVTKIGSASISGVTTHNILVEEPKEVRDMNKTLAGMGLFLKSLSILSALLVGMLFIFFVPHFMSQTTKKLADSLPKSLLAGVVFYLVAPIVILLLFISLIGIPLAILFIPMLLFMLFFAKIFVALYIGTRVAAYVNQKLSVTWMFIIGLTFYEVLTLVPVIGWLISLIALFGGTGALLLYKKELYDSLRSKKIV